MDIQSARQQIDQIDSQLVELYERRMKVAGEIGREKLQLNLPIDDIDRENKLIAAREAQLKDETLRPGLERVLHELIRVSKSYQRSIVYDGKPGYAKEFTDSLVRCDGLPAGIIGYSGIPGSYAHEAVEKLFPGLQSEGFNGFEEVFKAIGSKVDYGVLPIENSSTGGISEVYDLLRKYGAYIVGEQIVHVEHCLVAVKGSKLSDIKKVISHSEGLMQSREFLAAHPHWEREATVNTAVSARQVAQAGDKSVAAIASCKAAELYGLDILERGINFNSNNYTRFIVVSDKPECERGADKISLYMSLPHVSGSLASMLNIFSDAGLNMVKIESRPIYKKTWEYYFYIDIQADIFDANTVRALNTAAEHAEYMEILGAYKAAQK